MNPDCWISYKTTGLDSLKMSMSKKFLKDKDFSNCKKSYERHFRDNWGNLNIR